MQTEFRIIRRVTFAETDLAGVMHFSNYYRWMEEVEHAFLRSLGMSVVQDHGETTYSWPRVVTSCEYLAPVRFEDEIELYLSVACMTDKSITYEIEFLHKGQRVARGRMKAVCCMMSGGQFTSASIPDFIRQKFAATAIKP